MRKTVLLAAVLGIVGMSQAVVLDDFEGYSLGVPQSPWKTTEGGGTNFYGAISVDPLDGGNQYLAYGGTLTPGSGGDYRDISRPIGDTYVGAVTFSFDIYASTSLVDHAVGLCSSGSYTGGTPADFYDDYGPYCRIINSSGPAGTIEFSARNGGAFIDDLAYLSTNEWHHVEMTINFDSQTWGVSVDGAGLGSGWAFRKAMSSTDTVLLMGANANNFNNAGVDNLEITGTTASLTWGPTVPANGATGITNQPVLSVAVYDNVSQVDTNTIGFYLDGSNVAYTVSQAGTTTTVSHAVSTPLASLSTHTARVVVSGKNPVSSPITNEWSFTVAPTAGTYIPAGYTLYEDFESYPDSGNRFTNGVTTAGKWLYIDNTTIAANGSNTGLCDIENDGQNTFARYGWSNPARGYVSDIPDIAEGSSGSYFFRIKTQDATPDCSFGLSDQSITTTTNWTWGTFEIQIALTGSINLGARSAGVVTNLISGVTVDTWVNILIDVHNNVGDTNDTYDISASFGGDAPVLMASDLKFRNGTTNSLTSFFAYHNITQADRTACFDDIYYSGAGGGPTVNPDIQSINVAGGTVTLLWDSENGVTYSILHRSSLTDSWTSAKTGIAGGDPTTSDSVAVSGGSQEFFLIKGE